MIRYNVTVRVIKPLNVVATVLADDEETAEDKALERMNERYPNAVVEIVDIQQTDKDQ